MNTKTNKEALGLSFEYFPPLNNQGSQRLQRALIQHSQFTPEFASITYGASGGARKRTLELIKNLKAQIDFPIAGHLTSISATRDEVMEVADQYRENNVNKIIALRGNLSPSAKSQPIEN